MFPLELMEKESDPDWLEEALIINPFRVPSGMVRLIVGSGVYPWASIMLFDTAPSGWLTK